MRVLVAMGVVLTLGIAVGGLPAESRAAQPTLGCPATAQAGQGFTIEVTIDVGTTPLGAYSIAVTYDPAVLTLRSVAGGTTTELSGPPTANTPTPGTTNLSAFQTASLTSPTGTVSVARVTFNAAATASGLTDIGLVVNHLFDTSSVAILPVTQMGCGVAVTGGASTTTSSTSTTIATVTTSTTTLPPSTTTTTSSSSTSTSTTSSTSTTTTARAPTTSTSSTTTTTRPPTTTVSTTTTTRPPITTTTTTTTRPPTTTTTSSTTSTTGRSPTTTTAPLPTTGQCPRGSGFWKKHPALWLIDSLTLGSQAYTQAEMLALLTTRVRGDASLMLARSLIVAKLNIANGSDPTPIADTIADADALLGAFAGKLPYEVRPSSAAGRAMTHDAGTLNQYNSGARTPTCEAAASVFVDSTALLASARQLSTA